MEHSGWHILLFPRSLFAGFACTRQGAQPLEAVAARRGILPVHKYGVVTAQGFWPRRTRATLAREDGPFAVLDEVTQPSLIASKSFQRLREIRPPTHGGLLEVRLCCGACGSRQPRKIVQYMVSPSCVLMWGRVCCASCYCLHKRITRVGVKDTSRGMCRFWVASKGRRYAVCMRACFMG